MPRVKIERLEDGGYGVGFEGSDGRVMGFNRYTPEQFQALRLSLANYTPGREVKPQSTPDWLRDQLPQPKA